MSKDDLYKGMKDGEQPFRFDDAVASVFPDMLERSIPGYRASIEAIGSLAARFVTPGSNAYDLGCSLGAATLAMRQGIQVDNCTIVAVDNAPAMIDRCRDLLEKAGGSDTTVDLRLGDITETEFENASMVVMNYTLQFVAMDARATIMKRIADGMNDGGILVLSEKVIDGDDRMESLLVDLHHEHKRRNHYSELEIARKRAALENVLVPESVPDHLARLRSAGFSHAAVWLRYFNFVSIVAIK
ncbi:MAG: carboxy-S-adenosyl-L-methionine synthase CmoA [Pseudomonadota bacterium]